MVNNIGGYSESHLLRAAEKEVQKKTESSIILSDDADARMPRFDRSEFEVGKVLGRGGFCVVNEISKITLSKSNGNPNATMDRLKNVNVEDMTTDDIVQDRGFIASHYIREGKNYRYALKVLQESNWKKDAEFFMKSVIDLVIEARYLAVLRHPHIIKMRAVALSSPFEEGKPYFIVLDKLYDILSTRLKTTWKKRLPGKLSLLTGCGRRKAQTFFVERLIVAYDLTTALKYLHEENVIYRDLKPENIGFDVRDDVKIFDFGLAREIQPHKREEDGTYRLLTGYTGSLLYMAPEVALEKPYNEKCDVYSFCILLWEMLMVETPFEMYPTESLLLKKVVELGARPKPDPSWSPKLIKLLKDGWDADIQKRPSFLRLSNELRAIIREVSGEDRELIVDVSGRSEIFRLSGAQRAST
ncbi:hypothetical protein ACA910_020675 [Epithemia clementina (nom. ined.)]